MIGWFRPDVGDWLALVAACTIATAVVYGGRRR